MSAVVGDIAGSAYESHRFGIKDYSKVEMFSPFCPFYR